MRKLRLTKEDMLSELSSDMVSTVVEMATKYEDYKDLHAWLQPLFMNNLNDLYKTDEDLAEYYEAQLATSPYEGED